jgi:glyoxylase-like metal-dependent hydrolase (beta-lactamase superfamily II)
MARSSGSRGVRGFIIGAILVLAAFAGFAVLGIRGSRGKVAGPSELKPHLMAAVNAVGIGLFAARVSPGPHVIFFDTGLDQEGHPIDALLKGLGATRDDVTDVFLTHAHFDHIGGAPLLAKAQVHLGAADVPLATGKAPPEAILPRLLGLAVSAQPIAVNAPIPTGPATFTVSPADAAGGPKVVKAFPTPGHTPGSYVYLYDGVLITGDIMIFKQGRLEPTPGLFDPHPDQNKASIRSLKAVLENETLDVVCTAHGGCTPPGLGRNLLNELISRL